MFSFPLAGFVTCCLSLVGKARDLLLSARKARNLLSPSRWLRADTAERTLKTFACLRHAEAAAAAEAARAAAAREEKLCGDILHLKVFLTQCIN